jgi:hypothetical protein
MDKGLIRQDAAIPQGQDRQRKKRARWIDALFSFLLPLLPQR